MAQKQVKDDTPTYRDLRDKNITDDTPTYRDIKEKKKSKKCSIGTVYNAKLKKCVSNRKKGETLLEWRHRNTLESITKPKKKPTMG